LVGAALLAITLGDTILASCIGASRATLCNNFTGLATRVKPADVITTAILMMLGLASTNALYTDFTALANATRAPTTVSSTIAPLALWHTYLIITSLCYLIKVRNIVVM
jgi:hypothetical protein